MKQHITVEQLNELTDKGKQALREWWVEHIREFDVYIDMSDPTEGETIRCCEDELDSDDFPLLSIGQMIEFLFENKGATWPSVNQFVFDMNGRVWMTPGRELCDGLWLDVKGMLG